MDTKILFFVSLLSANSANPFSRPDECGPRICREHNKFNYVPGTTYKHYYEANVVTSLSGTSQQKSELHLQADIYLEVLSACEMALRLDSVTLEDSDPDSGYRSRTDGNDIFQLALEKYPLRFSFHDGLIEEICPNEQEAEWVLNIKRGILSSLQNTMKRLDLDEETRETDISGQCNVKYQFMEPSLNSIIVRKTKDASSCTDRYGYISVLQATPYTFNNGHQSLPVIHSSATCNQTVTTNRLTMVECEETHVFQPFSNSDSGAMTKIMQTLTYVSEEIKLTVYKENVLSRSSLLFQHQYGQSGETSNLHNVKEVFLELCKVTGVGEDVQQDSPQKFTIFIHRLRELSYDGLSQFASETGDICPLGRKHFEDALPLIGTSAAVAVIQDLIEAAHENNEEMTTAKANAWLTSIAFIPRPDISTITAATPFLKWREPLPQALLSVSTLVHTYCQQNAGCENEKAVKDVMSLLESNLGTDCRARYREEKDEMVLTLRAVGNLGSGTSSLSRVLTRCFQNKLNSMEVRVAALDAFRRIPCVSEVLVSSEDQDALMNMFMNLDEDAELRITAYLAVMRCPNYRIINRIKNALQNEEVNQVGSFVWTHLTNIQETSLPSRAEIQSLLADLELQNKFSTDLRKFSRNFETSMFLDQINTGASAESNIIFSTESYLPRSAMMNLTLDLFGQSLNIFEVGTRLEGFETYLESFFGPNGYWKDKHIDDILESNLQLKRSVKNPSKEKLDNLNKRFNAVEKFSHKPEASVFMRTFGNEIHYTHLEGMDEIQSAVQGFNPLQFLRKLTTKSSKAEGIKYRKSLMFLDSSYIIPTTIGLPLNLTALGSAVVSLKLAGSLKAHNFLQNKELEVQGEFHPSVSVDISGTMSVDAYVAKTGIKLKTSLHSATAADAKLILQGQKLVSMKLNLPKDKQEILNIKSELFMQYREKDKDLKGITAVQVDYQKCSGNHLEKILGIAVCGKLKYVNATLVADAPSFPLTGPAAINLYLEKKDRNIEGYIFEYRWDSDEKQTEVAVKFDTPGSHQDRTVIFQLDVSQISQSLSLIFQSPGNKLETKGQYKYEDRDKKLDVSVELNGQERFRVAAQLLLEDNSWNGKMEVLRPSFQLFIGEQNVAELKGVVEIFTKETSTYDHNLEFTCPLFSAKMTGQTTKNDATHTVDMEVQYQFKNERNWEKIKFQSELIAVSTKSLSQYQVSTRLEFSAFPENNFLGVWEFQKDVGHVKNKIEINSSPDVDDDQNKLTLLQILTYYTTYESIKLNSILQVKQPSNNLDLLTGIDYRASDTNLDVSLTFRYAPKKEIQTALALKQHLGNLALMEGNWNMSFPNLLPIQLSGKLEEEKSGEYKVTVDGKWLNGKEISLLGQYKNSDTRRKIRQDLQLTIWITGLQEIGVTANLLFNKTEFNTIVQGSYGQDKYSMAFKYHDAGQAKYKFSSEVICKDLVYTINGYLGLDAVMETLIDVHLDELRDIHVDGSLKTDGYAKDARLEVKWDSNRDPQKKMFVDLKLIFPQENQRGVTEYEGDLVFSYPEIKVISQVKGQKKENGDKKLLFMVEWEPQKKLKFEATTKSTAYSTAVDLMLLTPVTGWRKNSMSAVYNNSAGFHVAFSSLWKETEFIKFDCHGGIFIENMRKSHRLLAAGKFESSFQGYEKILVNMEHHVHQRLESKIEIQYGLRQKIAITNLWEFPHYYGHSHDVRTTIITPISGYKNIVLSASLHTHPKFIIIGGLTIEGETFCSLKIQGESLNPSDYKWDIIVKTPIVGYEDITCQMEYKYDWSKYTGSASLLWPGGNYITAEGLVKFDRYNGYKGHSIKILTPYHGYEAVILTAVWEDEQIEAKLNWDEDKVIGFNTYWQIKSGTDFVTGIELYTPLTGYTTNGATAKYQFYPENKNGLDMDFSLKLGTEKYGVDGGMDRRQQSWEGKMNVNLFIFSLGINANYADDTTDGYQSSEAAASIICNGIQIYEVKGTIHRYDPEGFRTDVFFLIISPTEEYSTLTSKFVMELKPWHLFKFSFDVSLSEKYGTEEKKAGFTLEYETNYPASNELCESRVVFGLQTPVEEYKDINIDIFLKLKPEISSILKLKLNEKEITLDGTMKSTLADLWQLQPGSLFIAGSMTNSVIHSKSVTFSIKFELEIGEENLRSYILEVKKHFTDGKTIELQLMTVIDKKIWAGPTEITLSVATPFQSFWKAGFHGKIEQQSDKKWDIDVSIMWNNNDVSMAGQLQFGEDNFLKSIQGTLTTPSSVLRQVSVSGAFRRKENGFETKSYLQWDSKKIVIDTEYKNQDNQLIELSAEATTPFENLKQFFFIWKMNSIDGNNKGSVNIRTPFENYLKNIALSWEYHKKSNLVHSLKASYNTEDGFGNVNGEWKLTESWEDFQLQAELYAEVESWRWKKDASVNIIYKNLGHSFTDFTAGFDTTLDHNKNLEFGINGTLKRNPGKSSTFTLNMKTPGPEHEIYTVKGTFEYENPMNHALYMLDYFTALSQTHYSVSVEMANAEGNFDGISSMSWGNDKKLSVQLSLQYDGIKHISGDFILITPLAIEETFHLATTYNLRNDRHLTGLKISVFGQDFTIDGDVGLQSVSNINGILHLGTPYTNWEQLAIKFDSSKINGVYDGTFVFTWPADQSITLILHHEQKFKGMVTLKTPWNEAKEFIITYAHEESYIKKECLLGFQYKDVLIFEIKYILSSHSSAGLETETKTLEIKNHFWPLGVTYKYKYEYSGGYDGLNLPTRVTRTVDLYDQSQHLQKLTGELKIRTTDSGQEITLSATHPNRQLQFVTGYDFLDHQFKHKSEFSWKTNSKISYEVEIVNKSRTDITEHDFLVKVSYPVSTFVLNGHFKATDQMIISNAEISWDPSNENKKLGMSVAWNDDSKTYYNEYTTVIAFSHPSLVKDIQIINKYHSDSREWFNLQVELEYAPDPRKRVSVAAKMKAIPEAENNHHEALLTIHHPESDLDLKIIHIITSDAEQHEENVQLVYQRGFGLARTTELKTKFLWPQKQLEIELHSPYDNIDLSGKLHEGYSGYKLTGEAQRKGEAAKYAEIQVNTENPFLSIDMYYDPELKKSLHLKGGIPDMRNVVFNIWREVGQVRVSDVASYVRLNHSRLLTAYLKWRPTLFKEAMEEGFSFGKDLSYWLENVVDETSYLTHKEATEAAMAVWKDVMETLTPLVNEISDEIATIYEDGEKLQEFLNTSFHNNDFHVKYLMNVGQTYYEEFAVRDYLQVIMKHLGEYTDAVFMHLGMYGEGIKEACTIIKEKFSQWYDDLVYTMSTKWYADGPSVDFTLLLEEYAESYNQFMKHLQWKSKQFFDRYGELVSNWLENQFASWIQLIGPTFLKSLDWLETTIWDHGKEILDFLYDKHEMLKGSPYLKKLYKLGHNLDELYNDLINNDATFNVKKYWNMLLEFMATKYSELLDYNAYTEKIHSLQNAILAKWEETQQQEPLKSYLQFADDAYHKMKWIYSQIDIKGRFWNALVMLYSHGCSVLTQTTLEANARYTEAKTHLTVNQDQGLIVFEQRLPVPWEAFNEAPKLEELPEYQVFLKLKDLTVSSEGSIWDTYYKYKPDSDMYNWIPPFKAQGLIAGSKHIMTFQKKFYSFAGYCEYVLASDFVDGNFTLTIKYTTKGSNVLSYVISLITEDDIFQYDFLKQTLMTSGNTAHRMPMQIGETFAYVEKGMLVMKNSKGFHIECNVYYEVCTVTLSGWHYGKTAGLLGTMDSEWRTDFMTPDHVVEKQVEKFTRSWEVSQGACRTEENIAATYRSHDLVVCEKFFKSLTTEMGTCFNHLDPIPFFMMCQKASSSHDTKEICQAAQSYVEACKMKGIPIHIPSYCIKCDIWKEEAMSEFEYRDLEGKDIPHSTDVVFIVELKECNRDLWNKRRIKTLIQALNKELTKKKIIMNRYAVVTFGGDGVFDKPRHVFSTASKKFTIGQEVHQNLQSLPTGNGNHDVFDAIRFAAQLNFRTGVSKTFILLPCSSCDPQRMSVDYSVLHRVMMENAITLHVLMNHNFNIQKKKVEKDFYGIDSVTAYTVKDRKKLIGNPALRRQVKLSKSVLGYCTPLALETNGTVFNALKLEEKKSKNPKKFAMVFAKRIAQTAEPSASQICECSANSAGTGVLLCYPSVYPKAPYIDYSFQVESSSVKQA